MTVDSVNLRSAVSIFQQNYCKWFEPRSISRLLSVIVRVSVSIVLKRTEMTNKSLSTTTVLFRIILTRTITLNRLLITKLMAS